MKAKISNNTPSPKGFYLGHKHITLLPNGSVAGDYEDALLVSLINTGFDVEEVQEESEELAEETAAEELEPEPEPEPEPEVKDKKGKK